MSESETAEELRQLRSAVMALTSLTQGMFRELLKDGVLPVEMARFASSLQTHVLDPDVRKLFESEGRLNDQTAQTILASRPNRRLPD